MWITRTYVAVAINTISTIILNGIIVLCLSMDCK